MAVAMVSGVLVFGMAPPVRRKMKGPSVSEI